MAVSLRSTRRLASSLVGSSVIYVVATLGPIGVTALVTPAITRVLGPREYGLVAIGLSIITVASVLLTCGLGSAITRAVVLEAAGVKLASALVVMSAVLAALGVLAGLLFVGALALAGNSSDLTIVIGWAVASSAMVAVFTCSQAFLQGLGQASRFAARALLMAVVPASLGLVMIAVVRSRAAWFLAGSLCGQSLLVGWSIAWLTSRHPPKSDRASLVKGLRVGLPTVPHVLAAASVTNVLVMITGATLGSSAAGEMQISIFVGSAPLLILLALNNAWSLRVYSVERPQRRPVIESTTVVIAFVVAHLALGACLLSPVVVKWLATSAMDQRGMARAAALVAAAAPIAVLYLANIHQVFASGRTGWLALSTPTSASVGLLVPVLCSQFFRDGRLAPFATGLVPFYLVQALFAMRLRKRAGIARLSLGWPVVMSSLAVFGCLSVALFEPSLEVRLFLSGLLVVSGGCMIILVGTRLQAA